MQEPHFNLFIRIFPAQKLEIIENIHPDCVVECISLKVSNWKGIPLDE